MHRLKELIYSKLINKTFLIKVTKADIIAKIAQKTTLDKMSVQVAVEAFFDVVKENMAEGENIYVRGFGSFINKRRAKKVARNISKKVSIEIPEHYVPSFKPSKSFVETVKSSEKVKIARESGVSA